MTYVQHTKPFAHQAEIFEASKDLKAFAFLWEQGTGKTKPNIDTACALWERGEIDAVVVVAPNGVHRNWLTDELPTHMPPRIRPSVKAHVWNTGKAAQVGEKKKAEELIKSKGFAWLFMSYSGFMTEAGKRYVWRFLQRRRCIYILDEAHSIKSPGTKRTKSVVASGKYAPYRRIMTGTPVSQGPFDIYAQMKFLDENFWKRYGFDSYMVFKQHFGIWLTAAQVKAEKGYDPGYDQLLNYRNLDELQAILKENSSRVTKDEVLDLPPKLYSKGYFDLTPEQTKLYKQLEEELLVELEEGVIDGSMAIVRLLRLQQITSGFVHTDADEPVYDIPGGNPRLTKLQEIVEGLSHPSIIWARFTKEIDQIMEMLAKIGQKAVRYDGRVSDDDCARAKLDFQEGRADHFVATTAKGGSGLTLIRARTVIYHSNNFKLLDRQQSEDRAHRIGQEHQVHYIDLVAPGTVDEHIVRSLRNKFDIANQITGDKLKEWI